MRRFDSDPRLHYFQHSRVFRILLAPTVTGHHRRLLFVACIAALLLCANGYARSNRSLANITPIFVNGTQSYACFRIPAIVRTPDGTLLAFAEARRNSCADFGDVRIVIRRSHNNGKTWSPLQTVAKNGTMQAGNSSPVVDLLDPRFPHGRVFLIYCTGNAPEADIMRGKGARHIWYRTSTDDGAKWSAPVEITTSVKLPSWREYATGPGHALQLTEGPHAGRILVAAYHSQGSAQPDGKAYEANTFFSDDHGRTWRLGATVDAPGSNESTAAQGLGGAVVMNSRDQSGSHARIVSISKDGSGHWDSTFVAHDLPDPTCEGSMIAYAPAKSKPVLLFSNAGNTLDRRDLTISVSTDGGRTWPKHTVIDAGPSSYSDIVLLTGHRLGILWERGNAIVFLVRPLRPLL